jgi:hypothetical protein
MELIFTGTCALTLALLAVHLAEYLFQRRSTLSARRNYPAGGQMVSKITVEPMHEDPEEFDQAA